MALRAYGRLLKNDECWEKLTAGHSTLLTENAVFLPANPSLEWHPSLLGAPRLSLRLIRCSIALPSQSPRHGCSWGCRRGRLPIATAATHTADVAGHPMPDLSSAAAATCSTPPATPTAFFTRLPPSPPSRRAPHSDASLCSLRFASSLPLFPTSHHLPPQKTLPALSVYPWSPLGGQS